MSKNKSPKSHWAGYTYDELQEQRALTATRIAVARERVENTYDRVRQGNLLLTPSFFSRMMSAINYADLAVIGIRLWRRLAPAFSKKR